MAKKYIVHLSFEEGDELKDLINTGKAAAYKRKHAEILLKADISPFGVAFHSAQISQAFGVSISTQKRVRQRLVEEGFEAALNRAKQTKIRGKSLDGEQEAHLIALTCSEPPSFSARCPKAFVG